MFKNASWPNRIESNDFQTNSNLTKEYENIFPNIPRCATEAELARTRDELYYGDEVLTRGTYAFDRHPYWRRAWIIQEVLLASKRMLLYGHHEFPWQTYRELMELFRPWIEIDKWMYGGLRPPAVQNRCYSYLYKKSEFDRYSSPVEVLPPSEFDMMDILQEFDHTQCTLPHDHIYSVLAVFPNIQLFPIDYDSGMVELLLNTSSFCLGEVLKKKASDRLLQVPKIYRWSNQWFRLAEKL